MPTVRKITFISRLLKPFRRPWYEFRDNILPEKTEIIFSKYSMYFTRRQLERMSIFFSARLFSAVVCEYIPGASYKDQLSLIFDFRLFLQLTKPNPVLALKSGHRFTYYDFLYVLSERARFKQEKKLGEQFFQVIRLDKSTFPMEYAEKYLDYIDEIARLTISEITDFMESQIYNFLPSEGPAFYASLSAQSDQTNCADTIVQSELPSSVGPELDDRGSVSKRVTFS